MLSKEVKQRQAANRAIRRMSCNKHFRLSIQRHKRAGSIFVFDGKGIQIFSKAPQSDGVFVLEDSDMVLPDLEKQKLALFDQYAKNNPDAWQPGFINKDRDDS